MRCSDGTVEIDKIWYVEGEEGRQRDAPSACALLHGRVQSAAAMRRPMPARRRSSAARRPRTRRRRAPRRARRASDERAVAYAWRACGSPRKLPSLSSSQSSALRLIIFISFFCFFFTGLRMFFLIGFRPGFGLRFSGLGLGFFWARMRDHRAISLGLVSRPSSLSRSCVSRPASSSSPV